MDETAVEKLRDSHHHDLSQSKWNSWCKIIYPNWICHAAAEARITIPLKLDPTPDLPLPMPSELLLRCAGKTTKQDTNPLHPLQQHQPTHHLRQPCIFFTIAAVWVLYTNGGEKIVLEPGKIMRLDKILCKTWAPLACNWLIQEYLSPVFLFTQPVKHNFTKSGNGQCCEQLWQENTHHWSLKWNTHFYNLIRNKHLYNLNQNSHPCNLKWK